MAQRKTQIGLEADKASQIAAKAPKLHDNSSLRSLFVVSNFNVASHCIEATIVTPFHKATSAWLQS